MNAESFQPHSITESPAGRDMERLLSSHSWVMTMVDEINFDKMIFEVSSLFAVER